MRIEAGYRECARTARRRARNFYYAFLFLPAESRRALYALYAFCRHADDLIDEDRPAEEARRGLADLRRQLAEPSTPGMEALADARARFAIPDEPMEEILRGVEMDLEPRLYETFEDARLYCTRVASAVGLACLPVLGVTDPAARDPAIDMGIAMQWTNILRDLREDAERGRIYLPREDLDRFGVTPDRIRTGEPEFPELMAFEAARAREHFERAETLFPLVPRRTRPCPVTLARLYRNLLDEMERRGYDVHSRRVTLSGARKLAIALSAGTGR